MTVGRRYQGGWYFGTLGIQIAVAALVAALLGTLGWTAWYQRGEAARAHAERDTAVQALREAQGRIRAATLTETRLDAVRRSEGLSVAQKGTAAAQAAIRTHDANTSNAGADLSDADRLLLDAVRAANDSLTRTRDVHHDMPRNP